jgi:hypothetical protein
VGTEIFNSERNRDDGAEMCPGELATIAPLREAIASMGIPTEKVAGDVMDAIRNDRFWIFTHDHTPRSAAVRFADIQAKRNPTDPYSDVGSDSEDGFENLKNLR